MIFAITDRTPEYLKAIYPAPVQLVNVIDEISPGQTFISWDRGFKVSKLTRSRIPVPIGRFSSLNEAIFHARR